MTMLRLHPKHIKGNTFNCSLCGYGFLKGSCLNKECTQYHKDTFTIHPTKGHPYTIQEYAWNDALRDIDIYEEYDVYVKFAEETIVTDPTTGGMKGQKDVRLHAIPYEALAELGRVYAFGEAKYADYNFRKGYRWSLSFDAMQRHLWAFWKREDLDGESGLNHLAHATWHGLALLFFSLTGRGTDDRPT